MISIIIPVYNAEKYLNDCINSILNQTYKDIEVLLIDDGSLDNSYAICKQYEKEDCRVSVYHKSNSGVSDTRNYGIERAVGEFISFCDADDVVDMNLYAMLYEAIEKYNVDRVVGGYEFFYDNGNKVYCKPRIKDGRYEANEILSRMIDDGTMSGFLFSGVHNSLFRKKIIEDNRLWFDKNIKYNEDSLFSFQYMLNSRSIYSFQSIPTYCYRQHDSSATSRRMVGDKYKELRNKLYDMDLQKLNINFDMQMRRRVITEALWQVLDIAEKMNGKDAIRQIRKVLSDDLVRKNISVIKPKELNIYKRYFYYMMKWKRSHIIYYSSKYILPVLSKIISR